MRNSKQKQKKETTHLNASSNQLKPLTRNSVLHVDSCSEKLQMDVKSINEKLMKEGEQLFYTRLPQKIIELTEFIDKDPVFHMPMSSITKTIAIDEYVVAYKAGLAETELRKEVTKTHKSYDEWRKGQTKLKYMITDGNNKAEQKMLTTTTPSNPERDLSLKRERTLENEKEIEKKQRVGENKAVSTVKKPQSFPPDCIIPINEELLHLLSFLNKEVKECVVLLSSIKMWISLKVPRMEDGNNLGVAVQEECVEQISEAEDEAYALLENMSTYYSTRGQFVSQLVLHPNLKDFEQCIKEVDQNQYYNSRLSIITFRNNYSSIYDVIMKNLDKLQTPIPVSDSITSFY